MSGPSPMPTEMKELRGNPSKRALNKQEPKPRTGEPPMPRGLGREAKREWKRLSKMLLKLGVLTVADGDALEGLCESKVSWRQAVDDIRKNGMVVSMEVATRKGAVTVQKKNPAISVMQAEAKTIKSYLESFGCTPASRTKVSTNANTDEFSDLEDLSAELDKIKVQ